MALDNQNEKFIEEEEAEVYLEEVLVSALTELRNTREYKSLIRKKQINLKMTYKNLAN